jgi:epoxide hydrolase 4
VNQLRNLLGAVLMLVGFCSGTLAAAKDSPVQETLVKANGIRFHCVSRGRGELLMFLHGFPEFWYEWKDQLQEFGSDHQVVACDLRGYNLSDKPAAVEDYRVPVLLADIQALADHFRKRHKFVLVGHDWGGALAFAFAAAHPEYLNKLVVINAPYPAVFGKLLASDPDQQKASQYMFMFRSPQAEKKLTANHDALLSKIAQVEAEIGASDSEFGQDSAAAVIRVPTLVIWGEKDPALPAKNLDGLSQYIPQLTIERIPDGTHWVIHEKPAEVNAYIREFIR